MLPSCACEACGAPLDDFGDHYSACMPTGRVQARAKPVERAWTQVFVEAGATVHPQKLLKEVTAFAVDQDDARRIDALVTGLPCYHGRPLFCDVTVRSPLNRNGTPHPRSAEVDGATFRKAQQDKERMYHDVSDSAHAELTVLAAEVDGRWIRPGSRPSSCCCCCCCC